MKKIISVRKHFIATIIMTGFIFFCLSAFAQGDPRGGGHHRPDDYHWRDGHWWVGDVITAITVGTVITTLPPRYEVVSVGGVNYYYDGVYYYQRCPAGYTVVANPVVIVPVAPATVVSVPVQDANITTINIPNKDNSFTSVTLTKYKDGYLGPQGEYYQGHPTVEQLKALYGK